MSLKSDRFSPDIFSIDNKSIISSNFMTSWALELCQKQTKRRRGQGGNLIAVNICLPERFLSKIYKLNET